MQTSSSGLVTTADVTAMASEPASARGVLTHAGTTLGMADVSTTIEATEIPTETVSSGTRVSHSTDEVTTQTYPTSSEALYNMNVTGSPSDLTTRAVPRSEGTTRVMVEASTIGDATELPTETSSMKTEESDRTPTQIFDATSSNVMNTANMTGKPPEELTKTDDVTTGMPSDEDRTGFSTESVATITGISEGLGHIYCTSK